MVWPWKSCFVWPVSTLTHQWPCCPSSLGPSPWLTFRPFLKFSGTYTSPRKQETCGVEPDLPGGPQGTGWSDFWMSLILKQNIILWKVYILKVMNMEYQILCCYPAKIILMESVCSILPSDKILQAALEVTMKNMDVFNIKLVCLLLLLLLFKPGFSEYLRNVYILKRGGP